MRANHHLLSLLASRLLHPSARRRRRCYLRIGRCRVVTILLGERAPWGRGGAELVAARGVGEMVRGLVGLLHRKVV